MKSHTNSCSQADEHTLEENPGQEGLPVRHFAIIQRPHIKTHNPLSDTHSSITGFFFCLNCFGAGYPTLKQDKHLHMVRLHRSKAW